MNEFFGLSMNYIMAGLLVVLGIALSTVGWVVLRNRIMFMMGLRNIPRRRAQTVLIVLGLMLSTLIISAALSIGDTVDYSITQQAYDRLHSIDETVQARTGESSHDDPFAAFQSFVSPRPFPESQANRFIEDFKRIPDVDGAAGVLRGAVPVTNERAGQSEPIVILVGVSQAQLDGFPDIETTGGELRSLDSLGRDEIYVNKSAADELDIRPGDRITIFVRGQPNFFTVKDIVKDRVLTGAVFGLTQGVVLGLERAQELLEREDEIDFIVVSNQGGVREGLDKSDEVVERIDARLAGTAWQASETKREVVDTAALTSSFMTTFFVILGLFSIAAGMMLIFLIFVMLAAERKVEMGMTRAVGTKRRHLIQTFMSEGMAYNVLAALIGSALGVVASLIMVRIMAVLFADFDLSIQFNVTPRSLIVSYSLGVVLTFITVVFSSWRISNLNIVRAIRDIPEGTSRKAGFWSGVFGVLMSVAGALLIWLGLATELAFPFMAGATLATLGLTLIARVLAVPARPAFTAAGMFLLVFWLLSAGDNIGFLSHLEGDFEMFFLSGLAMVMSCTFVLVFNADLMLAGLSFAGGAFSRLIPSLRTAVAYPMANRFRTGMTVAMISLVIFALVMMSTLNSNFARVFSDEEALGGYPVIVTENPSNPIDNLETALSETPGNPGDEPPSSGIAGVDRVKIANTQISEARLAPEAGETPDDFTSQIIYGASDEFSDNNDVVFQIRARGFDSDDAIWQALRESDGYAVIDSFALESDNFGPGSAGLKLRGVDASDTTFDPIKVQVRDASNGATRDVEIIGIISDRASLLYVGLWLPQAAFDGIFDRPESTAHYVRTDDGADADDVAKRIEKTLLSQGVQAESQRKLVDEQQALSRGFLRVLQGFMGLGLFVGIAAVGVIAFRTVVERRQHIGMLRAIGYTRGQVATSFVLESMFTTLLGVVSGIVLGLLLANQLVKSDDFGIEVRSFYIPWLQILVFGAFAVVASLLMTIIPSRQASGVPIAEALRYE